MANFDKEFFDALADPSCKIETIERLVNADNITLCNENGLLPLHIAVSNPSCTRQKIALLISKGASLRAVTPNGETPLLLAVKHNCPIEIVKMLLNECNNVNVQDRCNNTALHFAVKNFQNDLSLINLLLEYNADVMATNEEALIPLYSAFKNPNCNLDLVRILMNKIDFRLFNYSRFTPLLAYISHANFNLEIFEELVNQGANLWKKSEFTERNILHHAVTLKDSYNILSGIFRVMLKYKRISKISDMTNETDIKNETPLIVALKTKNIDADTIRILLENGADPNIISLHIPINMAVRACNEKVVELLLNYNASIYEFDLDLPPLAYTAKKYAQNKKKFKTCFLIMLKYHARKIFEQYEHDYKKACKLFEQKEEKFLLCKSLLILELSHKDLEFVDNFIESCYEELQRMKKEKVAVRLSLYDIVINPKYRAKQHVSKHTLSISNCINYKMYHSNIADYFDKSHLLLELQNRQIYVENNGIKITLNADCSAAIAEYLSNEDLLNLILTYYKPVNVNNLKRPKSENIVDRKRKRCKIDVNL